MLLANPDYSCLDSYIEAVEGFFSKNDVKCDYKSYDKEKDNYIFFYCYDLKSDIKIEDVFLNEVKYEGNLEFSFNKATNEVYISKLPFVTYGNAKVLVFTSDIANIIVEKLNKYIPSEEIKLVFANPLALFAADKGVINVIPSLKDTRNHKLLISTLGNIEKEKRKVKGDVIRYKAKQDRLDRKKEIAISKKRKISGLDPKDFVSIEDFQDEVVKRLIPIWNKRIENIERHLEVTKNKYKELILENDENYENITHMFYVYIIEMLQEKMKEYDVIDENNKSKLYAFHDSRDYNPNSKYDFERNLAFKYKLAELLKKYPYAFNKENLRPVCDFKLALISLFEKYSYAFNQKEKELINLWKYFFELEYNEIDKNMFDKAIMYISSCFPDSYFPISKDKKEKKYENIDEIEEYFDIDEIKELFECGMLTSAELRERICYWLKGCWRKSDLYYQSEEFLEVLNYFKKISLTVNENILSDALDYLIDRDLFSTNGALKSYCRMKNDFPSNDLKKIATEEQLFYDGEYIMYETFLRTENGCYEYLTDHPAFRKIYYEYKDSREGNNYNYLAICDDMCSRGNRVTALDLMMQIDKLNEQKADYKKMLKNPKESIFRNINKKDWGSLIQLPYWLRIYRDPGEGHEIYNLLMIKKGVTNIDFDNMVKFIDGPLTVKRKKLDYKKCDRLMVTIPNSLPIKEIKKIIDYAHEHSYFLNLVCENIETSLIVKKILINNAVDSYINGNNYFKDLCFVNVDPTYYDSFLINTPTNKNFWHWYDYSSDYKYKRKVLLSLDKQFDLVLPYCANSDGSIYYPLLDELMFGEYFDTPLFLDDLEDCTEKIKKYSKKYSE